MDRKKHIEFFLFLFCFCFITLGFLSFPLISLELCLDAIVDVFFFPLVRDHCIEFPIRIF